MEWKRLNGLLSKDAILRISHLYKMGVITPISLGCYTIFHLFFNVVF